MRNDKVTDSHTNDTPNKNFQEVVLAFLDVLGFSNLVREIGLEAIYAKYEKLIRLTAERTKRRTIVAPVPTGDGGVALYGGSSQSAHDMNPDGFPL